MVDPVMVDLCVHGVVDVNVVTFWRALHMWTLSSIAIKEYAQFLYLVVKVCSLVYVSHHLAKVRAVVSFFDVF